MLVHITVRVLFQCLENHVWPHCVSSQAQCFLHCHFGWFMLVIVATTYVVKKRSDVILTSRVPVACPVNYMSRMLHICTAKLNYCANVFMSGYVNLLPVRNL